MRVAGLQVQALAEQAEAAGLGSVELQAASCEALGTALTSLMAGMLALQPNESISTCWSSSSPLSASSPAICCKLALQSDQLPLPPFSTFVGGSQPCSCAGLATLAAAQPAGLQHAFLKLLCPLLGNNAQSNPDGSVELFVAACVGLVCTGAQLSEHPQVSCQLVYCRAS